MSVGKIEIDGIRVFHYKGKPYVSSAVVRAQKVATTYKSLYRRGLKSLTHGKYPVLDEYFRKHRDNAQGNRALLFPLKALAEAEKDSEFEGMFKSDDFFTKLLNGYMQSQQVNDIADESPDPSSEEMFSVEEYEEDKEEVPAPARIPRKNIPPQPQNDALLERLNILEQNMMKELREMQSMHNQEAAIVKLLDDPKIYEDAIKIAAENVLDEAGKTAILEDFNKRHEAHMAKMKKEEAEQETIFKSAQESRKRTTDEERATLARVRQDIQDERRQLEDVTGKRRRLENEMKDLQHIADQRAAALRASSHVSIASRAGKAPVVSSFMDSMFGRK